MQLKGMHGEGGRVTRNSSPAFNLINCTSLLPQCHDAMMLHKDTKTQKYTNTKVQKYKSTIVLL